MDRKRFDEAEMNLVREVMESGELCRAIGNSMVERFEKAFGVYLGRKYVLGVSSGTSANETMYASIGVEPGDEFICPASAPIFVSFPVIGLGCVPVFADVDPRTLIIDPDAIEERITPKTKAIVVVHLFGQPAQMDEIMAVAKKHNLKVLEDCSQSYDSLYKGRKVGSIGDAACFSLQQSKHMTSGEGGIFVTDDVEMYKRAVLFATCGMPWYQYDLERPKSPMMGDLHTRGHFAFGNNYRMGELLAAVALGQLGKLPEVKAIHKRLVEIIEEELRDAPGIQIAHRYPDTEPNYWAYPVRIPDSLSQYGEINYLEVEFQKMQKTRRTSVGYPLPDYVQYTLGSCPNAEKGAHGFHSMFINCTTPPENVRARAIDLRESVAKTIGI